MEQLIELRGLQIKRKLLADETRSPGETESLSLCHPRHLWSCWLQLFVWNVRKHLDRIFPHSTWLFNKNLAESCKRQREVPFKDGSGISRGLFAVSMTDGKCFRGKSAQVVAKNSMCKCTWQMQEKKTPRPLAWEVPHSIPLWAYDMSLYFNNVSWQVQDMGNAISTG